MTQHYDAIVVGLGAMGSAALYQLTQRGATVLGIDRYDPPHTLGSSHGETRIIRQVNGEGAAYFALVQRATQLWRELEAAGGQELLFTSGGLIIGPVVGQERFHGQADFVGRTAELARHFGVEHQLLSAADAAELVPQLRLRPDDHVYHEPGGGILLPERCIAVQLDLAARAGATMRRNEQVLDYRADPGGVIVRTDRATYQADKLILAAGAWMGDFVGERFRERLQVYRQVIYWFEADDPRSFELGRFPWVIWIGDRLEDFLTLFPTPPGGTPGIKLLTEQYMDASHPATMSRTVTEADVAAMYARYVAPQVRGVGPRARRTGICMYTVTPDEHFIIDLHPDSDRIVVASPCSGHGFKHSAAIGEILAQLALDGRSELDISPFSLARFT